MKGWDYVMFYEGSVGVRVYAETEEEARALAFAAVEGTTLEPRDVRAWLADGPHDVPDATGEEGR